MSLSRAFTMRSKNQREVTPPTSPKRSLSKRELFKNGGQPVNKLKISAPVQLISTTNMISYTSPSLRTSMGGNTTVQAVGLGFIQESNENVTANYPSSPVSNSSTPPLTPDAGLNFDDVFTQPLTPPANHLTDYFPKRSFSQTSTSGTSSHSSTRSTGFENRQIPRVRSVSSMNSYSSGTPSMVPEEKKEKKFSFSEDTILELPKRSNSSSSTTTNPSIPSKSTARVQRSASNSSVRSKPRHSKSHSTNPFAQELAKVTELAEDLGLDLDEDCMAKKGLWKYEVDDYMKEIYEVMCFPPTTLKAAVAAGANGWI